MPPALHPRSRLTLSLFTTTLALSFVVVGLPHLLPCPVNHKSRVYADGEMPGVAPGTQKRRRRRKVGDEESQKEGENGGPQEDSSLLDLRKRECPVPKPSGLVGQLLGFEKREGEPLPAVKVEKFMGRIRKDQGKGNDT